MSSIYDIKIIGIDGASQTMSDFAGKVILLVNVASACGLTPQYESLEKLYEQYKDNGLVVLGFPCNQFASQEPGTEAEIQSFCTSNFGVQFPMFSKIEVNGEGRHPLYQALIEAQPEAQASSDSPLRAKLAEHGLLSESATDSDIMWNFEKFLISRDGTVVGRFAPDITVDNPVLADAITAQLGQI